MRVLIVWENYFHYLHGIEYALRKNDCVTKKYVIEQFRKQTTSLERFATKLGYKGFKQRYVERITSGIRAGCEEINADTLLMINGNFTDAIDEKLLIELKGKGIRLILWMLDSIKGYKLNKAYVNNYDEIYSFEKSDISFILKEYGRAAIHLPVGADESIYKKDIMSKKIYDISFVGRMDKKRLDILEMVASYCKDNKYTMKVCGYLWKNEGFISSTKHEMKFKAKYPNLYSFASNKLLEPAKVCELYNKSKININIVDCRHSGANPRTFEILASGGFQLVEHNEGCSEIFKNKEGLVWYRDKQELIGLIGYYLKQEYERTNIAEVGHRMAIEQYLLKHSVRSFIRTNQ